jgi:uncharacterized protein (TIGR02453 family)
VNSTHFSKDYLTFLRALDRNNNREWFKANKARFEQSVKAPFTDFVDEIIHRVGALDPRVQLEPKDAMFRIFRDIRFSRDKTPYKTLMSAVVSPGGRRERSIPGGYFQFGNKSVAVAGGMYQPDKNQLYNIRSAIRDRGKQLDALVKAKPFKTLFGELAGDRNKVLPKEFKDASERFPLIANKQFYYWVEYPPETVLRDDLAAFVMKHYRTGKKLGDWLEKAAIG